MKLPNIQNKLSGNLLFIAILLTIILSFYLGWQRGISTQIKTSKQVELDQIKMLQGQVKDKEEEINSLIQDEAKFIKSYESDYSFSDFGLYSSKLVGQKVKVQEFNYKRIPITMRQFSLPSKIEGINYYIIIWDYLQRQPAGQFFVGSMGIPDYNNFDAYEQTKRYVTNLSAITSKWQNPNKNKYGIEFYDASPNGMPRYETTVRYPDGRSFLIAVTADFSNYRPFDNTPDLIIQEKKDLEEIMQTLSATKY